MEVGPVVSANPGVIIPVMCDADRGPLCGLLYRDADSHETDMPGASLSDRLLCRR